MSFILNIVQSNNSYKSRVFDDIWSLKYYLLGYFKDNENVAVNLLDKAICNGYVEHVIHGDGIIITKREEVEQ